MKDHARLTPGFGVRPSRRRVLTSALGSATRALGSDWPQSAVSAPRIEITKGNVQPIPIALPDFAGASPADAELARNVSQVITNDLRHSGLFAPIDPAAYIEKIVNMDAM